MPDTTYRTRDGEMLDWICWRNYGRQSIAVEAVLDANPGLAAKGIAYVAGEVIQLPTLNVPTRPVIRIWD